MLEKTDASNFQVDSQVTAVDASPTTPPIEVSEKSTKVDSQPEAAVEKPEAEAHIDAPSETDEKTETKPEVIKRDPIQKRIDRITKEKHEALRLADKQAKEIAELRAKIPEASTQEPLLENFPSYDAYIKAVKEHAVAGAQRQDSDRQLHDQLSKQQEDRIAKAKENFDEKLEEAFGRIDGFKALYGKSRQELPQELILHLQESEIAGDLAHELLSNEESLDRILDRVHNYPNGTIDVTQAIRELGRMEGRMMIKKSAPKAAPVTPKVGSSNSQYTDDLSDYSKSRLRRYGVGAKA